jgi:hypothetical protein
MCWETFKAREFPFDEARRLALGVGYDVDEAIASGLLAKKAGNVELVSPLTRGRALRKSMDDTGRLPRLVDALPLMLVTYRDDKLAAARTWLVDSGYGEEQQFLDLVQASVNAVPRVRGKKGLTVEEAVLLEDAVVGLFGDEISIPVEAQEQIAACANAVAESGQQVRLIVRDAANAARMLQAVANHMHAQRVRVQLLDAEIDGLADANAANAAKARTTFIARPGTSRPDGWIMPCTSQKRCFFLVVCTTCIVW